MSKINITSDLKKINIISCLEEISATGLDNENIAGKPHDCETPLYFGIDVFTKMNPYYKRLCVDKNSNSSHLCTYNGNLVFINEKPKKCNQNIFWNMLIDFINKKKTNKKQTFFFVSHHNRLKKTIFKSILDTTSTNKRNFANCCCIKIYRHVNKWKIKILFQGFPDKDINYFGKKNIEVELDSNTIGILGNELQTFLNVFNRIENKKTSMIFIRHGNAFHNSPLQTTGKGALGTIKNIFTRTTDSCLTPLGIYQARTVGNELFKKGEIFQKSINYVFSASYMNRAQHTMLEIMYGANKKYFKSNYKKLYSIEEVFLVYAISRLYRIITGIKQFNVYDEWENNTKWKNVLQKLSNHKEFDQSERMKKYDAIKKLSNDVNNTLLLNQSSCIKYLEKKINNIDVYTSPSQYHNIHKTNTNAHLGTARIRYSEQQKKQATPFEYLFPKERIRTVSRGGKINKYKIQKHKTKRKETNRNTKKKRKKRKSCKKRMKKKIICFSASNKKVTKKLLKMAKKIRKTKKINLSRCSKYRLKKWRKTKKK